jgi:hypothetical protein
MSRVTNGTELRPERWRIYFVTIRTEGSIQVVARLQITRVQTLLSPLFQRYCTAWKSLCGQSNNIPCATF